MTEAARQQRWKEKRASLRRCPDCGDLAFFGLLRCRDCHDALKARLAGDREAFKDAYYRSWRSVYEADSRSSGGCNPSGLPTMDEQEATAVARWFARLYSGEFRDWKDSAVRSAPLPSGPRAKDGAGNIDGESR